jgi:hypothetical protein
MMNSMQNMLLLVGAKYNVPLKEDSSGDLLVVLHPPDLLPAIHDITGRVVTEFLNHG